MSHKTQSRRCRQCRQLKPVTEFHAGFAHCKKCVSAYNAAYRAANKKKLADFAAKLLKNPRDVKERAALETFIARELYGLSPDDWKHLAGTFTFGSGESKVELDEIIRQSFALWQMPSSIKTSPVSVRQAGVHTPGGAANV